jgi:hypothetical protein
MMGGKEDTQVEGKAANDGSQSSAGTSFDARSGFNKRRDWG